MDNYEIITDSFASDLLRYSKDRTIDVIFYKAIIAGKLYTLDSNISLKEQKIISSLNDRKGFIIIKPDFLELKNIYERYIKDGKDLILIHSKDVYDVAYLVVKNLKTMYPNVKILLLNINKFSCAIDILINEASKLISYDMDYIENELNILNTNIKAFYYSKKASTRLEKHKLSFSNILYNDYFGAIKYNKSYIFKKKLIKNIIKNVIKEFDKDKNILYIIGNYKESCVRKFSTKLEHKLNCKINVVKPSILFINYFGVNSFGIYYVKKGISNGC